MMRYARPRMMRQHPFLAVIPLWDA
ncbi:hypothetical protein GF406_25370 [candidate division KSB1 bacterium]|nr:hypothetical protein [candidate division KSB1 bacterium]